MENKYLFKELFNMSVLPEDVNDPVISAIRKHPMIPKSAEDMVLDGQKNLLYTSCADQFVPIKGVMGVGFKFEMHRGVVKTYKIVKVYKDGSSCLWTFKNSNVRF